uniref:Uncharacterized protein n=1 Tax=Hyaloperonospora arabidopsidis (strain Emoy2) TaxID=559515 RepID=M4BM32_HYAAE
MAYAIDVCPTFLECDFWIREDGLARAKPVLSLAHRVSTLTLSCMMPMSIRSTSKKTVISIIAMTLLLSQIMMTMLVSSASPMTIPARMMTPSLTNRKRKEHFVQFAQGELNKTISRQQNDLCRLEKQWSVSCRTPSLRWRTGRNETLKRTEEQMFFCLLKAI